VLSLLIFYTRCNKIYIVTALNCQKYLLVGQHEIRNTAGHHKTTA